MVCKLVQIPPKIYLNLPLEANELLLNVIKLQQKEDIKWKKSLALSKSTYTPNYEEFNNSNMPNQCTRVKNAAKGDELIKNNKDHTYDFVD
jgi:hypothetical protein